MRSVCKLVTRGNIVNILIWHDAMLSQRVWKSVNTVYWTGDGIALTIVFVTLCSVRQSEHLHVATCLNLDREVVSFQRTLSHNVLISSSLYKNTWPYFIQKRKRQDFNVQMSCHVPLGAYYSDFSPTSHGALRATQPHMYSAYTERAQRSEDIRPLRLVERVRNLKLYTE